jgi:hypothetical protein
MANIDDLAFDAGMEVIHRCSANPYQFPTPNGDVVQFFLRHRSNLLSPPSFDNCRSCRSRVQKLGNLSGSNSQVLVPSDALEQLWLNPLRKYFTKISQYAIGALKTPIDGVEFVTGPWVCNYLPESGSYIHFSCMVNNPKPIDAETAHTLSTGIKRYIFNGQFIRLIDCLLAKGEKALSHVLECLQQVAYGVRLIPAMKWLCTIYEALRGSEISFSKMNDRDRVLFQLRYLFEAGISRDNPAGDGICLFFETYKNNLKDFLDENPEHLKGFIATRLDPTTYQRPTTEPSAQHDTEFGNIVGKIVNTVVELDGVSTKFPGTVTLSSRDPDEPTPAAASADPEPLPKFSHEFIQEFKNLKTCKDLMRFLRGRPEIGFPGLEVYVSNLVVMYVAESNVPELLKYPFLWAYLEKISADMIGIGDKWAQINTLVPLYETIDAEIVHRNFLVIPKKASLAKVLNPRNCCIPELFKSDCHKFRKHIETVNKCQPVSVPEKAHMVGLGTCQSLPDGELQNAVRIRIIGTGTYCTITHI